MSKIADFFDELLDNPVAIACFLVAITLAVWVITEIWDFKEKPEPCIQEIIIHVQCPCDCKTQITENND